MRLVQHPTLIVVTLMCVEIALPDTGS